MPPTPCGPGSAARDGDPEVAWPAIRGRAAAIVDADSDMILHWTSAAAQLFGFAAAEVIGTALTHLVPESLRAELRAEVRRYGDPRRGLDLGVGVPIAYTALHKTGTEITVDVALARLAVPPRGQVPAWAAGRSLVLVVFQDATARRQEEDRSSAAIDGTRND